MNAFIEPLILYAVLFFRFFTGPVMPETPVEFSADAAVARMVLHTGPSLALVWYLLLKAKSLKEWGVALPGRKDIVPALISFPAIVLVGLCVTLAARHLGGLPEVPRILPPTTAVPWAILVVSVFAGAYLEESFFRFYLLSRLESAAPGLGPHRAVLVSTLLFAVCHLYAGPWGFVNAAVSGAVLAYVFLRFRSLHGVGIAHGLYNVLVFALGPA
ncbi:MAG: CPBP family intramembrane metalloprotease [Treponema sp.]|nr:CPBP family intramembrane metalloprotease [Treponema sp.]